MSDIAARYGEVRARVARAAERAGRDPDDVRIVAVAKTFPAAAVAGALDAGITDIGESRAQELREKSALLGDRPRWHFVGYLQTNKVRHVVGTASLVHSVDRFGLAEAIARRATAGGIVQDVLVEVNVAGEGSKSGVDPGRVVDLARRVQELDGIRVTGLMTIPPFPEVPEDARPFYRELARLSEQVAAEIEGAGALSMGMTRDFEVAVEEGATLVRVGEAIFGPRA